MINKSLPWEERDISDNKCLNGKGDQNITTMASNYPEILNLLNAKGSVVAFRCPLTLLHGTLLIRFLS
jgi:hypothetical protein